MPCYSPLYGFKSAVNGGLTFRRDESYGEKMTVPCGGCLGCRLDRSREWASRIVQEMRSHDYNCFITLTYDDEHMPRLFTGGPGTLLHDDFQKFLKRLRKRIAPRKLRYYMCGEYGENTQRPHYHACIFGFEPNDQKVFAQGLDYEIYTSDMLAETWGKGFVTCGALTFKSAAYVARYVLKKVTGPQAHDHYLRFDDYGVCYWLEPEYNTMSRGRRCTPCRSINGYKGKDQRLVGPPERCNGCTGGIGRDFYEEYKSDMFPSDENVVPGVGVLPKVPRYYVAVLEKADEVEFENVKERRAKFRKRNAQEYSPGRLKAKYQVKKDQISYLKRIL